MTTAVICMIYILIIICDTDQIYFLFIMEA